MISLQAADALDTLLRTAVGVLGELRDEGLLGRMISVLACMLPEDREGVLQVLEHDAGTHLQSHDEDKVWPRFALRPNPFAHLYTRVTGTDRGQGVRYLETRRAAVLGVRMARSLPPRGEGGWEPETVAIWHGLSPEVRGYLTDLSRRILGELEPNRRRSSHV